MAPDLYELREKIFKRFFRLQDATALLSKQIVFTLKLAFPMLSLVYLMFILIHIGFSEDGGFSHDPNLYRYLFYGLFLSKYLPEFLSLKKRQKIRWFIDACLFLIGVAIGWAMLKEKLPEGAQLSWTTDHFILLNVYIILLIVAELPRLFQVINSLRMAPALLFALSFLSVIFIGSGLLMLPNAQAQPVSYLEALFTAASAVCVTGLIVVDTATAYTTLGKIIILVLIQLGGLGIMTFTGFFSYLFTGSATYKDRLLLRDLLSSETMGGLFRTLIQIVGVTFLIEIVGAVLIYTGTSDAIENPVFFSVFHAVSAFCNAGFSTLSDGLAGSALQSNYMMQTTIAVLIILGGIGFSVLLSLLNYSLRFADRSGRLNKTKIRKWHMITGTISNRIVLVSTIGLLAAGTLAYFLLERNALRGLPGTGQFVTSFFGSVSARTAGFNMVDITKWSYPTIFLMIFLMWVGASPGSTGGGIKTTTFAVALKASYDFIRGRQIVEIGNRQIGTETLTRVLVVILLSLVVIFTGFFILLITDPGKNPVHLLFEAFSAFGTVGLSITNTSTLSSSGKILIMIMMFIGRLGPLTVLMGLFVSNEKKYYTYPKQDLIIN
ncbi:MAG: potassium transporter TrkG [Prolixibacteraceae bacterium]